MSWVDMSASDDVIGIAQTDVAVEQPRRPRWSAGPEIPRRGPAAGRLTYRLPTDA